MEKLITTKELSTKLALRIYTIQRLCRLRKIPHYKVLNTYYFKESEIEKWLEERKRKPIDRVRVELIREVKI